MIEQIDELIKVLSRQANFGDSRAANLLPVYRELKMAYANQDALRAENERLKAELDKSIDKEFAQGVIKYADGVATQYKKGMEDAAHALSDVRRFVEAKWMSVANLPSEEAVLFDGPEPKHEANAIINALNRVAEFYENQSE